ncbi:hypothetical protein EDB89DRAFT_2067738 [Lactarius sanguifluus]|nr:hypothetical protein EDB89DRAFT_2067738 [Lactarius sanguifluus]
MSNRDEGIFSTPTGRAARMLRLECQLMMRSSLDAGDLFRITFLEREIATAQNELERLQSPLDTGEEAIKALERKTLNIGGSQLLAQSSKVGDLKLHIDITNKGITKAEVAMAKAKAKAEKDLVRFEGSIASLQGVDEPGRGKPTTFKQRLKPKNDDSENLTVEPDKMTKSVERGGAVHDAVVTACGSSHGDSEA